MSESADPWGERLPRQVSLIGAIAVLVGVTVGSGIFRVPATVAAQLQQPGPVIVCWILGGVVALCGALTLAELAGALPRSGGIFAYLLESFGPLPAFLFGWSELAIMRASALGATATIFAEYCGYFLPLTVVQVRAVAAAVIVVIGALNYLGVRRAAAVMTVATAAKYVAVMALGVLAFTATSQGTDFQHPFGAAAQAAEVSPHIRGHAAGITQLARSWVADLHLSLLATALIPVMWTYDGWADLSFMGGEVRNPQRALPVALILGTLCVMVVYLVVNLGLMHLLPLPQIAQSKLIAATAAQHIPLFGGAGAAIIAAVVLVSTFSGLNGSMMTGSRIFFAMADRGLFFRSVANVSQRFQTPGIAIFLATALGVVYVLQNDFAQLANKFILGIWPFYALSVAGVFVLRRSRPELPRPYRVVGYPLVPALFLLASLGMIVNALVTDPLNTGVTLLIIVCGVPVYYLWRVWNRRA